jgi:UDP-N-acetylglucosamine 2-epimerase (non-hydrolysing)
MTTKIKSLCVFGTRPEAIKMAPVVHALQSDHDFVSKVCVTGQHRDMLDQVLEHFEFQPDHDLNLMRPNQDLHTLTARILTGMRTILLQEKPDVVLVHGDTATAFATTLASFYLQIPVAHVEAGLRTGDLYSPFPEESNRVLIDRIAQFFFAPTHRSQQALLNEGHPQKNIWVTGNTVIDALLWTRDRLPNITELKAYFGSAQEVIASSNRIILVTGHRRESFGDGFLRICTALKIIAKNNPKAHIVYPVHLNPNVQKPVYELLNDTPNIHLIPPQNYRNFVALMNRSDIILTDSGGIQEEAPSLKKPTLVMRDKTERPEGVDANLLKLVGTNPDTIVNAVQELLDSPDSYAKMQEAPNPYGDGTAAIQIVQHLKGALS